MPRTSPLSIEKAQAYATSADFCRVLAENVENMYLLSFLLTSDHTKAEECLVSGLENCIKANYVFRDWARAWARRAIILNAVGILGPRRSHSTSPAAPSDPVNCEFGRTPQANGAIASILGLKDFERLVFVISVLERYSDQDCSVLLACSRQDVRETRMRALQHLAEPDRICTSARSGVDSDSYVEAKKQESNAACAMTIDFARASKE